MRVLVCGGRHYNDYYQIERTLNGIHNKTFIKLLIQGGARGADMLAKSWAEWKKVPVKTYHAQWDEEGKGAGHIRNEKMLKEGKPDLVIAFPGGKGTANMVKIAKEAKVKVMMIGEPIKDFSGGLEFDE